MNIGIQSRYPTLFAEQLLVYRQERLTSVEIVFQGNKRVAILGTRSGHLLKVYIERTIAVHWSFFNADDE